MELMLTWLIKVVVVGVDILVLVSLLQRESLRRFIEISYVREYLIHLSVFHPNGSLQFSLDVLDGEGGELL